MNNLKHLALLGSAITLLGASSISTAAEEPSTATNELSTTGEFVDGVAAVVDEGVVLKSELAEQTATIVARAQEQGLQLPPPDVLQEQVLERLIITRIQLQLAERYGVQISDQVLNQAIAEVATRNGVAFESLPAELASQGISYQAYRDEMREQMILEQLRRIEVIGHISVTPREIKQCLAEIKNNTVINSEYDLSHILISLSESATPEEITATEKKAAEVSKLLKGGADFGEMAVRYSDSETSLEGGKIGWRKGDQLPSIFASIVAPLGAGDISEPVRTPSGFHIVKVNDMRSANKHSEVAQMKIRHILITPNEIIDDETAQQKLRDAINRINEGEDFGEVAKILSDDPGSANSGGDMGWTSPGLFVPEFEKVAEAMEIGKVSEPFKSRFGWHILEVTDRRIYDNTEDLKEDRCAQQIRNSKVAEETDLWVRRLRDEAFVETRM